MSGSATSPDLESAKHSLTKWFKCLASALDYMHSEGVRHQDIKPSNIIHRKEDVYFTDFSFSSRFEVGKTTSTDNPARTSAMYAAPEVIDLDGFLLKHGRGTDVFALGSVFCEMLAIVTGSGVHHFHAFLSEDQALESQQTFTTTGGILLYGRKTRRISHYFAGNHFYTACVSRMLAINRDERPNASTVLLQIKSFPYWSSESCSFDILPATAIRSALPSDIDLVNSDSEIDRIRIRVGDERTQSSSRKSDSEQRSASRESSPRIRARHTARQSGLGSEIRASDLDQQKIEEEILQQIAEEGGFDHVNLGNMDAAQEEELSERAAQIYRRMWGWTEQQETELVKEELEEMDGMAREPERRERMRRKREKRAGKEKAGGGRLGDWAGGCRA
jgi:serine/threonine protein kinase